MRKATAPPDPECWSASWCVEHGPDVKVDEDGCCVTCGRDALGPGAERASRDRRRLAKALRDRRWLAREIELAQQRIAHDGEHAAGSGIAAGCWRCYAERALRAHGPRRKR